jgi:endonuclease III
MNKNLPIIFTYLKELFPNPETELHYSTSFQLVVAVMLSAQATDLQVNKVTEKLFKKIQKPEDLLALGFPSFKTAIRSINYYNTKAKHIYETASLLMKNEKLRIKNYKH